MKRTTGFSDAELPRARLLLDAAAGVVESEAAQTLAASTDTVQLDTNGAAEVLLPRWPVTDVAKVTLTGPPSMRLETPADYTWSRTGVMARRCRAWPCGLQAVEVTYTAGYAELPAELTRVVLELAARAWAAPAGEAGHSVGGTSIQWRAMGMEPTLGQQRIVERFRTRT